MPRANRRHERRASLVACTDHAGILALFAALLAACSEPLEFADWTVPVPEGTRIIDRAPVALEQRAGNLIEVEEDLVIGREDDSDYRFYGALGIAAAGDGTIHVYDAGNFRIQVYDASGHFVRRIGRRGGGPGEISFDSGKFALSASTDVELRCASSSR